MEKIEKTSDTDVTETAKSILKVTVIMEAKSTNVLCPIATSEKTRRLSNRFND